MIIRETCLDYLISTLDKKILTEKLNQKVKTRLNKLKLI